MKRNNSLDVIRSIAIFSVVCMHTASVTLSGDALLAGRVLGSLGVPLFVMLTGYLMVDREYSEEYLSRFVRRNLIPLLVAYELWNAIWYVLSLKLGSRFSAMNSLLIGLFMHPSDSSFWFLPMIIGIYIGLPLFSVFARLLNAKPMPKMYVGLMLVAMMYFGTIVPTLREIFSIAAPNYSIESVLNMNLFGADVWGDSVWILYLLLGFLIKKKHFDKIPTVVCVAVLFGSLISFFAWNKVKLIYGILWETSYANILLVLSAIALFIICERHCRLEGAKRVVVGATRFISAYSFSTYMIHYWVLYAISPFIQGFGQYEAFGILFLSCAVLPMAIGRVMALSKPLRRWLLLIK